MELSQIELDTYRRCILRELNLRKKVYPKRVELGKMKQEQADIEIETMEKIKDYFADLQFSRQPEQRKLF